MRIIIPTRNRSDIIADKALRLFPDATLCVGEDEVDAYARLSDNLLVHPAGVVGIGPLQRTNGADAQMRIQVTTETLGIEDSPVAIDPC